MVATKERRRYDSSIEENEEDDQSTVTVKSRTLSGIRRSLSLYFQKPYLALRKHMPFRKYIGPERKTAPHNDTVVWNLIFLVMFFTSLCLAARFPSNEVCIAFVSISGVVFIALSASVSIDLANHGRSKGSQPCLKNNAHHTTRQPQIHKESRQHDADCAPQHSLDDGIVLLRMVSTIEPKATGSQSGHCGR